MRLSGPTALSLIAVMGAAGLHDAEAAWAPPEICRAYYDELQRVDATDVQQPGEIETTLGSFSGPFRVLAGRNLMPDERNAARLLLGLQEADAVRRFDLPKDGDDRRWVVLSTVGGAWRCHGYRYFRQQGSGPFQPVDGPRVSAYENEGKLCERTGTSLAFVQYRDRQTLAVLRDGPLGRRQHVLFELTSSGAAPLICRIRPDQPVDPFDHRVDGEP